MFGRKSPEQRSMGQDWKRAARSVALAAGIMGGMSGAEAASPEEAVQHVESDQEVTDSARWAESLVHNLESDVAEEVNLKGDEATTKEHVSDIAQHYLKAFVREFFFPTKGKITEGAYGVKNREYSKADLKLLAETVSQLETALQKIDQTYGTDILSSTSFENLKTAEEKIRSRMSPAHRLQQEALQEAIRASGRGQ